MLVVALGAVNILSLEHEVMEAILARELALDFRVTAETTVYQPSQAMASVAVQFFGDPCDLAVGLGQGSGGRVVVREVSSLDNKCDKSDQPKDSSDTREAANEVQGFLRTRQPGFHAELGGAFCDAGRLLRGLRSRWRSLWFGNRGSRFRSLEPGNIDAVRENDDWGIIETLGRILDFFDCFGLFHRITSAAASRPSQPAIAESSVLRANRIVEATFASKFHAVSPLICAHDCSASYCSLELPLPFDLAAPATVSRTVGCAVSGSVALMGVEEAAGLL